MTKFNVGDIITGTKENTYGCTNRNALMVVVKTETDNIDVYILSSLDRCDIQCVYAVPPKRFEKTTEKEYFNRCPDAPAIDEGVLKFLFDTYHIKLNTKTETNNEPIKLEGKAAFTIKSYKTLNDRVLIVEFADGDIQKSICDEHDTFDFERGLEICVMKHVCGRREYHKVLKVASEQISALDMAEEKAKADKELLARKKMKADARKAARKAHAREMRVGEMAEAFSLALKENGGNVNEVSEGVLRKIINTFKGDK